MLQVDLTLKNGEKQTLGLPLKFEEVLKHPMPFYLARGTATVHMDTHDAELNEKLEQCLLPEIQGGVRELSLLAYMLGKMNTEQMSKLAAKLPTAPCAIDDILQCACTPTGYYRLKEQHDRHLQKDLEDQRMTGGQLFKNIMECARENGDLARFDGICEYVLSEDYDLNKLCSYEFDMLPAVNFGGSEGIYVDCYLKGKFDENGRKTCHIGTIKTLSEDMEGCKIMGELCGILLYHKNRYVSENLYRFESPQEIEKMLAKPLTLEQQEGSQLVEQQL